MSLLSEELYNCRMWRERASAEDILQVHLFASQHEAKEEAARYRAEVALYGGQASARVIPRDIKVAGCRLRVWCLVRR